MISPARALVILALSSACIVAQEVLLTRLLSLTTWYTLAFAVLSLAMLGLTSGALRAARARRDGEPEGPWISRRLTRMSVTLLVATAVTTLTPVNTSFTLTSFASMLLVTAVNGAPMVEGASVVAFLMSDARIPVGRLYAVDLCAAASGALAPLVMLGPLSAPSALLALSVLAGVMALAVDRSGPRFAASMSPLVALVAVMLTQLTPYGLVPQMAKGKAIRDTVPPFEAWNPLSYVMATDFAEREPVMWGRSPRTPPGKRWSGVMVIDGDAWTPMYGFHDPNELTFLRYDVTAAAHAIRPSGTACVIGVGGGRDVLTALALGHDHVLGIEINPAIVDILHKVELASPIVRDPRLELVVGDGRAVLAGSNVHCTVLQASAIDTWAATSAGAFTHTEATLYTREAWSIFLRRVEPDGIVTFSRWFEPHLPTETSRLVALGVASLLDRGVAHPRDHLVVLTLGSCATILVSPSPFTQGDLARLHALADEMQFTTLISPDKDPDDPLLRALVDAHDVDALGAAGAPLGLDTSAPTDDRPFFFQLLGGRSWLHPLHVLSGIGESGGVGGGVAHGNAAAMFELLAIMLAVALVGVELLGPTLVAARSEKEAALPGGAAYAYFGLLGAGFMMTEIGLVQRMHVVLGHPTYALVVVLASLLVASGAGSAVSARLLRSRRSVSIAAFVACVVLVTLPYLVIGPLARRTLEAPLAIRAAWTGGTAALVGFVLGMLFPSGLRFVPREQGTPVALALNGVTSVIGSALAVVVSVVFSISTTFAVAGVLYLLAALAGPSRWRAGLT